MVSSSSVSALGPLHHAASTLLTVPNYWVIYRFFCLHFFVYKTAVRCHAYHVIHNMLGEFPNLDAPAWRIQHPSFSSFVSPSLPTLSPLARCPIFAITSSALHAGRKAVSQFSENSLTILELRPCWTGSTANFNNITLYWKRTTNTLTYGKLELQWRKNSSKNLKRRGEPHATIHLDVDTLTQFEVMLLASVSPDRIHDASR